jgi:hypothetical protein
MGEIPSGLRQNGEIFSTKGAVLSRSNRHATGSMPLISDVALRLLPYLGLKLLRALRFLTVSHIDCPAPPVATETEQGREARDADIRLSM